MDGGRAEATGSLTQGKAVAVSGHENGRLTGE